MDSKRSNLEFVFHRLLLPTLSNLNVTVQSQCAACRKMKLLKKGNFEVFPFVFSMPMWTSTKCTLIQNFEFAKKMPCNLLTTASQHPCGHHLCSPLWVVVVIAFAPWGACVPHLSLMCSSCLPWWRWWHLLVVVDLAIFCGGCRWCGPDVTEMSLSIPPHAHAPNSGGRAPGRQTPSVPPPIRPFIQPCFSSPDSWS